MIKITTQTGQIIPIEEVQRQEVERKVSEYKSYLSSTDWKFARLAETGEPVDEETLYKRTEARNYIRENENTI